MSSIGYVIVNLRFSHKKSSILYLYNCIVSSFCPDCKTNLFFCRGFFHRPVSRGRFPPNLRPQTGQNLCKSGIAPVDMRRVGDDRGSPGPQARQHQCRPPRRSGPPPRCRAKAARRNGQHPACRFGLCAQAAKTLGTAEPALKDHSFDVTVTNTGDTAGKRCCRSIL
mgnify:CR=1 FL=1